MVVAMPLISRMVSLMPFDRDVQSPVEDWMAVDLSGDIFGRLRRLAGEFLDLGCDHRKTPSGFSGPRRLDGRIQRQQIGLAGDRADQAEHVADFFAGGGRPATISVVCPALATAASATSLE